MAVEVIMPKFGLTMHDGTIQRYFKAAGESVSAGEPLYEVETEKVLYEVEAPSPGILAATLFPEGETVECGVVVAVIAEPGEDVASVRARYAEGTAAASAAGGAKAPSAAEAGVAPKAAAAPPPSVDGGGRRPATPVARKLAAELGIELARVGGSGPGGRITREDVEAAAAAARSTSSSGAGHGGTGVRHAAETSAPAGTPAPAPRSLARRTPMRGMRKTIAERMAQSLRDSAQLTITTEADVTAAVELRERLVHQFDCTYTDLLIQAAARALRRYPRMNSRLAEHAIVAMPQINVGMAVALEEGLIVPVVKEADRKELRDIAVTTRDLGERARTGKLRLEDVSDGTFTVTNLGTYGIDAFTPILNLGETGILGVGRIVEKPQIHRGEITRRWMMTLSLTFDHRIIDGAPAAQFLQAVIEIFNFGER